MKAKKQGLYEIVRKYSAQMVSMQRALVDAGLIATAARINAASHKLGWEAAKIMEKEEKKRSSPLPREIWRT